MDRNNATLKTALGAIVSIMFGNLGDGGAIPPVPTGPIVGKRGSARRSRNRKVFGRVWQESRTEKARARMRLATKQRARKAKFIANPKTKAPKGWSHVDA